MSSATQVRVSSDQFLELVEKSEIVPPDAARRVRASLRDSVTGRVPEDPREVAAAFVEAKLLTKWQSQMLLRGKHKGFKLGKYRLLDEIGSGGMSRVYLAEHLLMRRRVAIKVLPPTRVNDSSYLARFRREAEAIAQLDHPNIVRAFDIDQEGNAHYFVMEYIDGRDFLQIVKEDGPLEYRLAADYVAQVAQALHHAHAAGLIHRDIKPGNCIVERSGTVKLLDLGLAKFVQETGPSLTLMHDENVLGTADYLAPEQARDSHTVDQRADIYSLGCTFYFLLTGHPPFPTGTLSERLIKHQRDEPAEIRLDRPDVPGELVAICSQMMHKSPDRRFEDAGQVAARLRGWLDSKPDSDQGGGPFGAVWRRATHAGGSRPADAPSARPRSHPRSRPNGRTTHPARPVAPPVAKSAPVPTPPLPTAKSKSTTPQALAESTNSDEPDLSTLPRLSEIELPEEHLWESGSHYLPRRYSMGGKKLPWIWFAAALAIGLLALILSLVL